MEDWVSRPYQRGSFPASRLPAGQTESSALWPSRMTSPIATQALTPRYWAPASTIMDAPMAQMTCSTSRICPPSSGTPSTGDRVQAVEMIATSTNTSQRPRLTRNAASSLRLFLPAMRPAEVPARNTNTGAQKCVTQRVRYRLAGTSGWAMGSCTILNRNRSREWSIAIMTITRPRSMSIEVRRYDLASWEMPVAVMGAGAICYSSMAE